MELSLVMRTTPATREFTGEPVPDETLRRILDHARFAPSGGNRQGWRVIVVEDPALRRRLRELYQRAWKEYWAHVEAGVVAFAPGADRFSRAHVDLDAAHQKDLPNAFADQMEHHPVLLVVAVELSALAVLDHGLDRQSIVGGASIYPFCHNVLLKARDEGLGGVMTTAICREESGVADLLGIPPTHVVASLIALGRPAREVTELSRRPVDRFTTVDRFDGPPLQAARS